MVDKTSRKTKGKAKTTNVMKGPDRKLCACGCSKPTAWTFAQGHDAKAHSVLRKVERGELKFKDLPPTLRTAELAKGDGLIARLLRKLSA